jgi:hypothetical protein
LEKSLIEEIRSNLQGDDWLNPKVELRESGARGAEYTLREY